MIPKCPKCGSVDLKITTHGDVYLYIHCQKCPANFTSDYDLNDFAQFFRPSAPSPQPSHLPAEVPVLSYEAYRAQGLEGEDIIAAQYKATGWNECLQVIKHSGVAPSGSAGQEPPSQKVIEEYQRTWRENNNKGPFGHLSSDIVNDLLADFVVQFFSPSPATEGQPSQVECKGRKTTGDNNPGDCDWPFCGCNPNTNKVMQAIQESGYKIVPAAVPAPDSVVPPQYEEFKVPSIEPKGEK